MGSHVTFPKIKKAVHKVMLKYGKKKFYRKVDWIDKVLEKLKIKGSQTLKSRIRNHINKWLEENSEKVDANSDSKKGVSDSKCIINPTANGEHSIEKKGEGNINNNKETQQEAQVQQQVGASKSNNSNKSIPPMPEGIPIKNLKKKIEVIDIASEDEKKVTETKVEVITIDDDIEIIDEKVLVQQPLIINPEQYYSYYDYCLNKYVLYPVVVQPHFVNFSNAVQSN